MSLVYRHVSRAARWVSLGLPAVAIMALSVTIAAPVPANAAAAVVSHAEMRDWLADGERGLWIQAGDGSWFYARLLGICRGLNATNSLAFDTPPSGNIDRSSAIVVPGGGRCAVQSLSRSAGPPPKRYADIVPEPQSQ